MSKFELVCDCCPYSLHGCLPISGPRLSTCILGGRRPSQSVLHRAYPAQAPEAAQSLRRSREGKRDRLRVGLRNRERAISEAAPARSPTRPPIASKIGRAHV